MLAEAERLRAEDDRRVQEAEEAAGAYVDEE